MLKWRSLLVAVGIMTKAKEEVRCYSMQYIKVGVDGWVNKTLNVIIRDLFFPPFKSFLTIQQNNPNKVTYNNTFTLASFSH